MSAVKRENLRWTSIKSHNSIILLLVGYESSCSSYNLLDLCDICIGSVLVDCWCILRHIVVITLLLCCHNISSLQQYFVKLCTGDATVLFIYLCFECSIVFMFGRLFARLRMVSMTSSYPCICLSEWVFMRHTYSILIIMSAWCHISD